MEVISNDQDALILAVGPPDCIIGWSAIASKGDPLRLHPGGNSPVSLVISIGRQGGKKVAKFGGMLSQEIRTRHPLKIRQPSNMRHGRERGSACGKMQELAAGKFHFEPSFTSFDHLVGAGKQTVRH